MDSILVVYEIDSYAQLPDAVCVHQLSCTHGACSVLYPSIKSSGMNVLILNL